MLVKEYRIAMPISKEEYQVGQLYMIAKHSHEQSDAGDGVEVIHNVPHNDVVNGNGQYTEKRIHLSSRLPYWLQSITPRVFYVIEKAWNYYPYTETEYTCSFLPKFSIFIRTKYENNAGTTDNCLDLSAEELASRVVDIIDIAYDEVPPKHYKETEDPKFFKSKVTNRGPLAEGWKDNQSPIMCSYKLVKISFEVWGLQTRVEDYAHKAIRDILLLGHRQAFTWIDEWFGMTVDDVRNYEKKMQEETNIKVLSNVAVDGETAPLTDGQTKKEQVEDAEEAEEEDKDGDNFASAKTSPTKETAPGEPCDSSTTVGDNPVAAAAAGLRSWLNWS